MHSLFILCRLARDYSITFEVPTPSWHGDRERATIQGEETKIDA